MGSSHRTLILVSTWAKCKRGAKRGYERQQLVCMTIDGN